VTEVEGEDDLGILLDTTYRRNGKFYQDMNIAKKYKTVAGVTGLEPAASGVTGRGSSVFLF
jgi:hypothetical protein